MKKHSVNWLFLCCWLTYLTAYLCRVNFSSALHTLTIEKGFTAAELGVVGAVFYAIYACGQLINGYIGDRVQTNRYVLIALCGTLLCNLGMAFAGSLGMMTLLWGGNGIFQSMFWSTIIRGLAQNTKPEKRATVSMGISLAMPVAYLVSWGLLGQCLAEAQSRWYFLVPCMASLVMILSWILLSKHYDFTLSEERKSKAGIRKTVCFLFEENLQWMIVVCMFHGLIKEGAAYWTPLLIAQMDGFGAIPPHLLTCVLPLANLVGIVASRALLGRNGSPYSILVVIFSGIILLCGGLILSSANLLIVGLIALVSGMCYASNTILLSFIPMQYTERNMVASIIGVFDFASYVGASISTYLLGRILESFGFAPLPVIWLAAAVIAILLARYTERMKSTKRNGNVSFQRGS